MKHSRYVLLVFAIGAILVGWLVQSASGSVFMQFAIPDNRILDLFSTSSALGVAAGVAGLLIALRSVRAMSFTSEVVGELARVTWPSRDETVRASTTVVLTTLFVSALLAFYDIFWKNLADMFLFTQG